MNQDVKDQCFRLIYLYSKMRTTCNVEVLHELMPYFMLEDIENSITELVAEEKIFEAGETFLPK